MSTEARGPVRATALAVAILAAGCGKTEAPGGFARPPSPVVTAVAAARDVPVYVDEVGRCVASESVTILPQVSGRVTKVEFADGADLGVDAPLFQIDARPYQARLDEAKARLASATANAEVARAAKRTAEARVATATSKREEAKAQAASATAMAEAARAEATAADSELARASEDARRMEAMAGTGAISQQELTKARTDATAAEGRAAAAKRRVAAGAAQRDEAAAAVASAEDGIREAESQAKEAEARVAAAVADESQASAAVEPARLDVEYCSILSPIAGRAGRRLQDVGNVVLARTTPLLSIQRTDPLDVEFAVVERDLPAVHRGLAGKKGLQAQVRLEGSDEERTGDVTFLDNAVSDATGTVRMRARVANADARFWPGRFARVRLLLGTLPGAILVPATAPQVSAMGPFVYVAQGPDAKGLLAADMRPVSVGQRQGDLVVIEKGLSAGERVVVQGQVGVYPGAAIAETPPAAAPGAPPAGAGGAGPGMASPSEAGMASPPEPGMASPEPGMEPAR
jgi:multidrug efflux system membrane fusion protein